MALLSLLFFFLAAATRVNKSSIAAMKRSIPWPSPLAALLLLAIPLPSASSSPAAASSAAAAASPFHFDPTTQYPTPSLLRDGIPSFIAKKWSHAQEIALLEQAVEDHNAEYVATSNALDAICYRRCIVLPLDERFDPPMAMGVFIVMGMLIQEIR